VSAPKVTNRTAATRGGSGVSVFLAGVFPPPPDEGPPNNVRQADFGPSAPRPAHLVAMSQGSWAYSTGDGSDVFERGVYREANGAWINIASLPCVLERLTRGDGNGRRSAVDYRLAMVPDPAPGDVVVCDDEEVRTGTWAGKLDVALSADDKIVKAVATAIRDTARKHAQARESTPRWHNGVLELPSTDVGPAGYGATAWNNREFWLDATLGPVEKCAADSPNMPPAREVVDRLARRFNTHVHDVPAWRPGSD
jgi:hypothetical protein